MANRIVSVHAGIYGMGIYAIMLPSSGFSVAHCVRYTYIWQFHDEVVRVCLLGCGDDFVMRDVEAAVADVLRDGQTKEYRLLADHAQVLP